MALKYNVYLDNKIYKSGLSDKKVKIEDLKADTSYKVCITAIDGDKESAKSCTNFKTKQEMKKPEFVAFDNDMINVTPGKPTRLVVAYDPMDLGEVDIVFTTDKGTIKDGYITLDNVGDIANINASVNGVDSKNTLIVSCVKNEIELDSFEITLPPTMEIGEKRLF